MDWDTGTVLAAFALGAVALLVAGSIRGWDWPWLPLVWLVAAFTIIALGILLMPSGAIAGPA